MRTPLAAEVPCGGLSYRLYMQDARQVIRAASENLDAILAGQAVFLSTGIHRGEVLEWPNRAAC